MLQFLDHLPNFVLTLSKLLLKPSKQFVFFTFRKHQIVIGKISVLLFKLALQLVPRTFHLQLVHSNLDVQQVAVVHLQELDRRPNKQRNCKLHAFRYLASMKK